MRTLDFAILLVLVLVGQASRASAADSVVDLLAASPDHSLLLRAFQRARLVPILNQLNESTLFAPTNDAIRRAQRRERDRAEPDRAAAATTAPAVWSSLDLGELEQRDNLQLALRETLLYHCLNYTLFRGAEPPRPPPNSTSLASKKRPKPLPVNVVTLQESLYYPSRTPFHDSFPHPPTLPGSPPDDKPSFPARPPRGGLLRGEGQKLRVIRKAADGGDDGDDDDEVRIGVDWRGEGGIKASVSSKRFKSAKNGVLVPLDDVLTKPRDLATLIQSTPSLSTFASLLPPSLWSYLANTSHVTLFAPTNEAWASLSELEMRYLRSEFSQLDMEEILQDSSTRTIRERDDGTRDGTAVGYLEAVLTDRNRTEFSIETSRNNTLHLETSSSSGTIGLVDVKVNGTLVEEGDILAENGVLHTIPSLLLPQGSLALTAEKYLLALNCTKFVSLLHSVNLTRYVQIPSNQDTTILPEPLPHVAGSVDPDGGGGQIRLGTDAEDEPLKRGYTILALKDSLLASVSPDDSSLNSVRLLTLPSFPSPGSRELEALLSYHILATKYLPRDLRDGMLVGTELRPDSLDRGRQRLAVSVQSEEGGEGEGWERRSSNGKGRGGNDGDEVVISFGNANAIAEPVEVGHSIIYLVSTILEPPTSVISTAVSDLRLSTFIASVYSAKLDQVLALTPSVTYLVPTNQAFERLGLVMSYLLLPTAARELEQVLRYHAIDEVVYGRDFPRAGQGSRRYPTLEPGGSEIYLETKGGGGGAGGGGDSRNSSAPNESNLSVHGPTLGGFPANGEQRDGRVVETDLLTDTGVLHVLDQVELPPTVDVTVDKLMKGAKSTTMVELIREANLSWVLEGKQPHDDDDGDDDGEHSTIQGRRDVRRAYTILCPTDKALSRLNLTFYLTHPEQLTALIKLHIIPTDAIQSASSSLSVSSETGGSPSGGNEEEGTPLLLSDSISYATLHSREQGGKSKFGRVAFKRWGTERGSWMVGIEGARGTKGESDSARVVNWGRATPWIVRDGDGDDDGSSSYGGGGRMRVAAGGGVILIDSVLLPWEPGWFRRWGWIVLTALVGSLVLVSIGAWAVQRWRRNRKNRDGYERVEGEED